MIKIQVVNKILLIVLCGKQRSKGKTDCLVFVAGSQWKVS